MKRGRTAGEERGKERFWEPETSVGNTQLLKHGGCSLAVLGYKALVVSGYRLMATKVQPCPCPAATVAVLCWASVCLASTGKGAA